MTFLSFWNSGKYALRTLFIASVALLAVCAIPDPWTITGHKGAAVSGFNSSYMSPLRLSSLEDKRDGRIVRVSMFFRPAPGNADGNLFQTASGNSGMRAELVRDYVLSALIARGEAAQEVDIAENVIPGVWHKLEIIADVRNRTRIYLDGTERREMSVPESQPRLDAIMVGAAFDGRRPFRGEIKDFSIQVDSCKKIDLNPLRLLFLVLFLVAAGNSLRFLPETARRWLAAAWEAVRLSAAAVSGPVSKTAAVLACSIVGIFAVHRYASSLRWLPVHWLVWGMASVSFVILLVYICDFLSRAGGAMTGAGLLPSVNLSADRRIKFLSLFVLAGFLLAVLYHFIFGIYRSAPYPYNTFLFHPEDMFNDIRNPFGMVYGFRPYMPKEFMETAAYFPFAYLPIYAFSVMGNSLRLPLYMGLFALLFVWLARRHMRYEMRGLWQRVEYVRDFFIITFLSYPFMFALDRANFEMYVFLFVAFFLYFFRKGNDTAAVLCLSAAIASKGYPAIFMVLLLKERKYRTVFHTLVVSALMTVVPLFLYRNGFSDNLRGFILGLSEFKRFYVLDTRGYVHNSCIYNVIRLIYSGVFHKTQVAALARDYSVIGAVLGLLAAAYVWMREKSLWKQVLVLSAAAILVTPVSGNYKLLMLFLPLWLFIEDREQSRFTPLYCLFFAILLIPKEYPFGFSITEFEEFRLSGFLNPLFLLTFCGLVALERSQADSSSCSR